MTKRYGDPIRSDVSYKIRPSIYAILPVGQHLLLTHQAQPFDEIQLPGGGIDPGEQPIAALHREVFEETGWTISSPRRLTTYRRFGYMPDYDMWAEKVCHIYIARPVLRIGPPSEAGHSAVWLHKSDAEALLASHGDREILSALVL